MTSFISTECRVTAPASPTWRGLVKCCPRRDIRHPRSSGSARRAPSLTAQRRQESRSAWQGRPCHCRPPGWRRLQPADHAAGKPDGPPDKPRAEANFNTTKAVPEHVATARAQQATAAPPAPSPEQKSNNDDAAVASRSESVPPGDVEKAASAPPDSVNNPATLPAVDAATDLNIRTLREQVTAAAALPAPDQKADNGALSDRPETIEPGDTNKAASAPPYDVAALEPTASAVVDSNTRTIRQQVIADIVIAEHVMTLRDAEKAASDHRATSTRWMSLLSLARKSTRYPIWPARTLRSKTGIPHPATRFAPPSPQRERPKSSSAQGNRRPSTG